MMKHIVTFAVMGIMAGAMGTGCMDSSGKKVEDAKEAVDNAKKDLRAAQAKYSEEWQTFKRECEHKLKVNESSINEFKEKMETAGSNLKAKYGGTVEELERKNHDLEEKIEDYRDQGEAKWEAFKNGVNRDMQAIETALKDIAADNG